MITNNVFGFDVDLVCMPFSFAPEVDSVAGHGPSSDGYDGYFRGYKVYRSGVGQFTLETNDRMPVEVSVVGQVLRKHGVVTLFFAAEAVPFSFVAADSGKDWTNNKRVQNGRQLHFHIQTEAGVDTDLTHGERINGVIFFNRSTANRHE